MIGETLTHYEIFGKVGAGGMGDVYRARDTKLHREVAIKLLSEKLAPVPERLARFEREAHLLASLNHPNIATIHGLEKEDGTEFLVLELIHPWKRNYDISPDGKRFLMIQSEEEPVYTKVKVVLNWFSELERLVPRDD